MVARSDRASSSLRRRSASASSVRSCCGNVKFSPSNVWRCSRNSWAVRCRRYVFWAALYRRMASRSRPGATALRAALEDDGVPPPEPPVPPSNGSVRSVSCSDIIIWWLGWAFSASAISPYLAGSSYACSCCRATRIWSILPPPPPPLLLIVVATYLVWHVVLFVGCWVAVSFATGCCTFSVNFAEQSGRSKRQSQTSGGKWPVASGGKWPVASGGKWPVAASGQWRQVASGGKWPVAHGKCVASGEWWQVASGGKWPVASGGKWRVAASGQWQVAHGEWQWPVVSGQW